MAPFDVQHCGTAATDTVTSVWQGEPPVVREALASIKPYTKHPSSDYLKNHFRAANILADANIRAVVFGSDALMCAHNVPYQVPYCLQLLLHDRWAMGQAAMTILDELQTYSRYPDTPNSLLGDLQGVRLMLDDILTPPKPIPHLYAYAPSTPLLSRLPKLPTTPHPSSSSHPPQLSTLISLIQPMSKFYQAFHPGFSFPP